MSTIKVDTVQSTGGGAVTLTNQEAIKVWVNFDGSSLSGTGVNDSFNVTSMTDNGTGDYTTNITNNMGNTNYCHLVHAIVASNYTQYLANSFAKATGSYREEQDSFDGSSSTVNRDHTHCNLGILGDLA